MWVAFVGMCAMGPIRDDSGGDVGGRQFTHVNERFLFTPPLLNTSNSLVPSAPLSREMLRLASPPFMCTYFTSLE